MEKKFIQLAKQYSGCKDSVDPNDPDERYYNSHKCAIYDAFLAGVRAHEALDLNIKDY